MKTVGREHSAQLAPVAARVLRAPHTGPCTQVETKVMVGNTVHGHICPGEWLYHYFEMTAVVDPST